MKLGLGSYGLGDTSACGTNPCSWWDTTMGVALPMFMSANCQAYLGCVATGGSITPNPANIWTLNGGEGAPNPNAGGVSAAQALCEAEGNTWNALTSQCVPAYMVYVPWIVAGVAALVILPPLLSRR